MGACGCSSTPSSHHDSPVSPPPTVPQREENREKRKWAAINGDEAQPIRLGAKGEDGRGEGKVARWCGTGAVLPAVGGGSRRWEPSWVGRRCHVLTLGWKDNTENEVHGRKKMRGGERNKERIKEWEGVY